MNLKADKATTYTKTEVDGQVVLKQNTLTPGTVSNGYNILQDGVVRAMKAVSPIWLAPDANHLEIGINLTNYATNTALDGKQNTLTAGTGMVFHEKLLEGTKVKSLVAGEHITMTSTDEFVNISADLTTVNTQLATKANTTYVDQQFASKTFPWFSNSESGYRYIDTGPAGLVLRSGTEPGMQILGTDSTPEEGEVFAYRGMTVLNSLTVDGVNVITELGAKANQATTYTKTEVDTAISNITIPTNITVSSIDGDALTDNVNITAHIIIEKNLSVNGTTANMAGNLNVDGELATNSIIGNGANAVTVNDNLNVTGNLDVGFNLTCGDITATAIYGTAATQIQSNINTAISNYNPFWVAGKVDPNANVLVSKGKVGFTVTRTATGNYRLISLLPTRMAYITSLTLLPMPRITG